MKVLVVDDEIKLADAVGELLRRNKFVVDVVYDGEDGYFYAKKGDYDVILLDVMMPGMDGFEVASRVKGLDCGADDYLTKPFASEELLARIRALTRRQSELVFDELKFEDITLNTSNYTLTCGQKSVTLGAKEYEILRFLMMNANCVISKDTIISKIWGLDSDITENNVEAYMSFLRKKLFYVGSSVTIMTKRLLGYYLEKTE